MSLKIAVTRLVKQKKMDSKFVSELRDITDGEVYYPLGIFRSAKDC